MKKLAFLLILLILPLALAQTECHYGKINCTDQCSGFTDSNSNGICDLSEEKTAISEDTSYGAGTYIRTSNAPATSTQSQSREYNLVVLPLISALLYGSTYFLVKMKAITIVGHRKIWNIVLLISFLVSGILGILLVIRLNFGWNIPFPSSVLFYHVEAGIIMTVIAIFHILWHWPYFKSILWRTNKN